MRIKTFFIVLFCGIVFFFSLVILKSWEKPTFQSLVTETHKQIHNLRNFKDNLKNVEEKRLQAEEKHLALLGFTKNPRLYPKNCWTNTTLPIIVTALFNGEDKMVKDRRLNLEFRLVNLRKLVSNDRGISFAKNTAHMASSHAVLMYNVGLSSSELQTVTAHCNTSQCQIVPFDVTLFPSHIQDDTARTVKALIIQDALNKAGGVLYIDNKFRIVNDIEPLLKTKPIGSFVTKQAVSTLTHPNMMTYFTTSVDGFLFLPMVETSRLLLWNTPEVHRQVMLPWIQCVLTPECVHPIGAQSQGCRFNKKPQYRYSGCHAYDSSALNVVLGLTYHFDNSNYTFSMPDNFFVLSTAVDNTTVS